jgi:hexosaminidase
VAPGVNNWSRLYPNNNEALGNIRAFVRDGQALGATGVLNTVWNDDGEGIFDENWFGVLFGAAAGWQAGESSEDAFTASYGLAFHRDPTGKISQAQRELMAAHACSSRPAWRRPGRLLLDRSLFAGGPARGASSCGRSRASELRLHAERAITLVAEAKAAARLGESHSRKPEALDAMELGARRIDFVGLKFQAADESAALYAQAQSWPPTRAAGTRSGEAALNHRLEQRTSARHSRRLRAARRTLPAGLAARQPALLAREQPGPLRRRAAQLMDRPQLPDLTAGRVFWCEEQWWNTHKSPVSAG